MPGRKCPTVRSSGTTSVRSALMPTLMTSRASMNSFRNNGVVPANAGAHNHRCRFCAKLGDPACRNHDDLWLWVPACAGTTVASALLLRRGALDKGLAALHLVGERRLVDLDHDRIGVDAEVFHQRLRDVAHHAGLLLVGAAGGHAHGNFRHFSLPFFSCDRNSNFIPM